MIYVGSLKAFFRTSLKFSSTSLLVIFGVDFKIGTITIVKMLMIAKTTKTDDHGIISKSIAANGGPTTWPAEPAAVVMPNASDLFSSGAVLPTPAHIGPKPLPAIPTPHTIFKN